MKHIKRSTAYFQCHQGHRFQVDFQASPPSNQRCPSCKARARRTGLSHFSAFIGEPAQAAEAIEDIARRIGR